MSWKRYRFTTQAEDYRPIKFNPSYPWWCSGYDSDDNAIIVAYLPKHDDLFEYWDDASNIDFLEATQIVFSDRFPKPDWFKERCLEERINMPITPKPLQIEVYCRDCGTYLEAWWDNKKSEIAIEPCKCPLTEVRVIYERYKLNPHTATRYALWQAIKAACEPKTLNKEDVIDENRNG